MQIAAIIVLILLFLGVVIASIRKRRLCIGRGTLILAAVCIGVIVWQSNSAGQPEKQYSQLIEKAPAVVDAPYFVQTDTRAYYVATYQPRDSGPVLTNYYYYDKKNWQFSSIPLPLDEAIYGKIRVHKRNF